MPGSIAANTACDLSAADRAAVDTCAEIIRRKLPNLFRLYLNPYVAQTCYCLNEAVQAAWPFAAVPYQTFLANGVEEALSGAIKLARYDRTARNLPTTGTILDEANRWEHFAFTEVVGSDRIEYVPGLEVVANAASLSESLCDPARRPGFIVVSAATLQRDDGVAHQIAALSADENRPLLIVCIDRDQLFTSDPKIDDAWRAATPDLVVFDESFVDFSVPFGAFAAPSSLYERWNRRGMATFHSTTFQPNTISTLHFMNCLRRAQPGFVHRRAEDLVKMESDLAFRRSQFRRLYSPSLAKVIAAVAFDQHSIRAVGNYIESADRRLFDGVAGVACSIRGHNPEDYAEELMTPDQFQDCRRDCRREVARRLQSLTGLPHVAPAVSGASAVESALKLALAAQAPRNYVLALEGGYGGKTLFALTGTAKPSLKAGLDPLYPHVVYVNPFADDAEAQIEAACERLPIGVIQVELIQGVGGVRAVPSHVLRCLERMRERHGCFLFVDEVQTGVYRTGPFVRSSEVGLQPDLMTIGKATSDMMFPCSLTLYSDEVRQRLDARGCTLPHVLETRHGYEIGYRTVLNTLRRSEFDGLERRVRDVGEQFSSLLAAELKSCRNVRDVRCFGLLIGIELEAKGMLRRRLRRLLPQLYLLAMMNHRPFPLVVGYCQYEPNVLKLTPPLSITDDEIRRVVATIGAVLRLSPLRLASSAMAKACTKLLPRPQLAARSIVS